MPPSRFLLTVALSTSLVLSGCTGDDEPAGTTATTAPDDGAVTGTAGTDASGATGDADGSTATGRPGDSDAATATGGASGGEAAEEPEAAGDPVVTVEDAEQIAADLLGTAEEARNASGSEAEELRLSAYNGPMREASRGAEALRSVTGEPGGEPAEVEPTVLAISRENADGTKYLLAQTLGDEEIPRLHLLATGGGPENFRIIWEGDMLPGTELGVFERLSAGSPVVGDDGGDLYFEPAAVLRNVGRLLDYPIADSTPNLRTNGYAPEVRRAAREQAGAVAEQAAFEQDHRLLEDRVVTLELQDGSALCFGVLERRSAFAVRDGMQLSPPESFTALGGSAALTDGARVDSLVFVAVHVSADDTAPEVVAVHEQIVGARGS